VPQADSAGLGFVVRADDREVAGFHVLPQPLARSQQIVDGLLDGRLHDREPGVDLGSVDGSFQRRGQSIGDHV
jgi:hypothetical protein